MATYRERLIAAREKIGISRAAMAKFLMTPRQTLDQWENGSRRTPGVAVVAAEVLTKNPESAVLPVRTPLGVFSSYVSAAKAHGITKQRVHQKVIGRDKGWQRLGNTPGAPRKCTHSGTP